MLADRMQRIATSPTLAVLLEADRLKRRGVDVISLGAGEPDFATPDHVKAAAQDAIDKNFTRYTPNAGIVELRRAIAERYQADYGVAYDEADILVTAGGKQALANAMLALFGPGDEVITHSPGWPSIPEQIKLADAAPVIVRTHPEDGFALDPAAIEAAITARTRGLVLNSPCNPTGALISEEVAGRIAGIARAHDLWVVIDLCYERLIYDPVPHNLPRVFQERLPDRTVLSGSASKAYAMTGWRCGWAIGPREVIAACGAIQSHMTSNVCSVTQRATVAALSGSQDCVRAMLAEYRERRDNVWAWLAEDPRIRCVKPGGAFYLFVDIGELLSPDGLRTSADFARALLQETHVVLTAGEAFDAPGFVRISYATSMAQLREGTRRILEFAAAHAAP